MCENNKYAISVPIEKQLACEKVSDRAIGYGMPGITVDGNDPLEVYKAVKEAVDRGRRGEGPTLVETVSYRLTPHSSDDDDRSYRAPDEVAKAKTLDPIITFSSYLKETAVMNDDLEKEINDRVMKLVNDATDYAENAPYAAPEEALKYVYTDL
jgi:2-oxoisovalerate dehydrogenase E1 component alpha subunit